MFAGQAIAVKVSGDPTSSNNGIFYFHNDHLGSTSVLTKDSDGYVLGSSVVRYYPFGGYRDAGAQELTDRGYTGHKENLDIGLIYMNARFYVPGIARFASADTIVPNPANPQSFNRYSYVENNPINFNDPSGHCAQGDVDCWDVADRLYKLYGWTIEGVWSLAQVNKILSAAIAIEDWFTSNGSSDAQGNMRATLGEITFAHTAKLSIFRAMNVHHVWNSTVSLLDSFSTDTVIHEIGHVLDNKLGFNFLGGSAVWGMGPGEDMAIDIGQDVLQCGALIFRCPHYGSTPGAEPPPTNYGKTSPSEDFSDTFLLSVVDPASLGPERLQWMANLATDLQAFTAPEFSGSPYSYSQRFVYVPTVGFIVPGSGGKNGILLE